MMLKLLSYFCYFKVYDKVTLYIYGVKLVLSFRIIVNV